MGIGGITPEAETEKGCIALLFSLPKKGGIAEGDELFCEGR